MTVRSVGVEEELLPVEPGTGQPRAVAEAALRGIRALAGAVASRAGAQLAALATSPVPVMPQLVREGRYPAMARAFGLTAHERSPTGSGPGGRSCWLSANSPFRQGRDSQYASFRYQAWGRWPTSGPTDAFGTAEAYRQTVRPMVRTGTLLDTGMVYFDARLSEHYPTLEIRIASSCSQRCWPAGTGPPSSAALTMTAACPA
jgi:glutamate---cysteine ligase / carboxylate-amine ligase